MNRSLLILALLGSAAAMADNTAVINNSGKDYVGNVMINQAAGNQQQSANNRAVALGGQASTRT
ncbi:adhesin, partial [Pseudomonas simiae]|nr:adhesin [Pseudomonas simiae]